MERKLSQKVNHVRHSANLILAIKIKTVTTVLVLFFTILFSHYITFEKIVFITIFIILSVIVTGAMLEQKKWIFHLEFLRFAILCFIVNFAFPTFYFTIGVRALITLVVLFYNEIQSKYQDYLYTN